MIEESLKSCRAALFDFDGVLCRDYFYDLAMRPEHGKVCDWIRDNLFRSPDGKELVCRWMRGEADYRAVNRHIAGACGVDASWLDAQLLESVRRMQLDAGMLNLAAELRSAGKKVGIVTDNMDVFSIVTVPDKSLSAAFDFIANSADYGCLKADTGGRLFDVALSGLGVSAAEAVLLDDSPRNLEAFAALGGRGVLVPKIKKHRPDGYQGG